MRKLLLDVSVIIVNWNTAEYLKRCLTSLVNLEDNCPEDIIVVDNASTDSSLEVLADFSQVKVIRLDDNLGFAKANNAGIKIATKDYILLLNSDTEVFPHTISGLVVYANQNLKVGAVSPRLLQSDNLVQPYAFGNDPTPFYMLKRIILKKIFNRYLHDWYVDIPIIVDWVSFACVLIRRRALDQIGLLDDRFFMYFEDNDFCLRLRLAGWNIVYNPLVSVVHFGGMGLIQSEKARKSYYESLLYFYRKHYGKRISYLLELLLKLLGKV